MQPVENGDFSITGGFFNSISKSKESGHVSWYILVNVWDFMWYQWGSSNGSFMPAKVMVSTLISLGIKWDTVMGYNRATII